ncbi:MAG: MBL fold metallo-hydrolase [Telluria sp.]
MTGAALQLPAGVQVFERGWLSSNNILFTGGSGATLVDSGYVTHAPQTLALVRHALQGAPLERVLNTHLHSDHCGGNALLRQELGARIAIPAAEAAKVAAWDEDALTYRYCGQKCDRFVHDEVVAPGDELELGGTRWQALAAPGHDPHSLILWCPSEGIVISADALWENGFGVIFGELDGQGGFAEARATLELIAGLDARLAIPGHGAPFAGVAAALARARARVDFLEADPLRNAQNAVKVILKFILLEHQRMPLAQVYEVLENVPVFELARTGYFPGMDARELADWVMASLCRAGAARVDEGVLVNRD